MDEQKPIYTQFRKWRPTHKCIYVISDVFGDINSLEVIFSKILPLRKFINQEDMLIMLGNYIDYNENSSKVLDALVNIKEQYKDRVIFLRGEHEEYLLKSIYGQDTNYNVWLNNGGAQTIFGYLKESGSKTSPYSIPRTRLSSVIKKEHIDFLSSTKEKFIYDNYVFFHGSFNHEKSIEENTFNNFIFDYTASRYVKECVRNKQEPVFKDNYVYVGTHNYKGKKPYIHSRYLMLGGLANRITIFELNSMTACTIKKNKSRIYAYNFDYYD